jgi:hypothetical protein
MSHPSPLLRPSITPHPVRRLVLASVSISSDHAIHLPIRFDQINRVKTDAKVVRTDREMKKVVRIDRKLAGSEKQGCYVWDVMVFVRRLRRAG